MKLLTYLNALSKEDRPFFCQQIGTTERYIRRAESGNQKLGAKTCVKIEQVTMGYVTRKDLRPDDWYEIWPELLTTPKELNRESTIS